MAKNLLIVQLSIFSSESAFSAGGHLIDDQRTSIDLIIIDAVMCLKDRWKTEKEETRNRSYQR